MAFDGSHHRPCVVGNCKKQAGPTGRCSVHSASLRRAHTSDGVSRKGKLSDEQVAEARRMLSAFKSKREVAQHLGVTVETLNRYLRKAIQS